MRGKMLLMLCLAAPGLAQAIDCSTANLPQAQPLRPTVLAPVSSELAAPSYLLGAQSGVLAHAYDESQSVDQVLLRLRIEGCKSVARAIPAPSIIDPNDPSVYKPKTEFDNTPWRFDMNQNGKRMTADEFDAWMKSRGVRVARGTTPVAVPMPAVPANPAPGQPPGTTPAVVPSVPAQPPGTEPATLPADGEAPKTPETPQTPR